MICLIFCCKSRGQQPPLPAWADRYALTRFTISSPHLEDWFKGYNQQRPWTEKIRPGSFGLIAHPSALTGGALPAATYEPNPDRWPRLDWYDRRTGKPIHVTTLDTSDDPDQRAHALQRGDVPIQRLHDTLTTYRRRPEPKSLDPTGDPAGPTSRGLLQRRPITSSPTETELIGKEGNKLIERASGETTDPADYRNTYGTRVDRWQVVVEVLREMGVPAIVERTGYSRSAVYATLNGATPHGTHAQVYTDLAVEYVSSRILAWGITPARGSVQLLVQYRDECDERDENVRRCEWCGKPLPPERRAGARFDSDRCRQAARRAAQTSSRGC